MTAQKKEKTELFKTSQEGLRQRGAITCVVVSGSMEPVIMTGERLTLVPMNLQDLRRFDILVFEQRDILICHTLWGENLFPSANGERTFNTFPIAGAGKYFDMPVPESDILGKVASHEVPFFWRMRILWNRRRRG